MKKSPWYNYWMPRYQSDEPNYFESHKFEWAQKVLSKKEVIQSELLSLVEKKGGKLFPYYSPAVSTDVNEWHTLSFKTWGIDVKPNLAECPELAKLISSTPEMVSASVNILMPNARLGLHQGDSNTFYRCHLGVEIPGGLPEVGFEVEKEQKAWSEDDLLIFLDAKEHTAWNFSEKRRIIFVFDIIREDYLSMSKKICFNVRSFLLMQWLAGKYPGITKWNKTVHRFIFWNIKLLLIVLYPYQKRKGVILKHS